MPETTLISDAQYRDSAIQDMLGRPPGWLLRSGLTVIALTVAVVLGLAAVIRYPERVEAPFVLQTETVPLAVHAGAGNYVEAILVEDRQPIAVGDTLMVFRSDGNWRTTRQLRAWLEEEDSDETSATDQNYPSVIAPVVSELQGIRKGRQSYLQTNGVTEQVAALEREVEEAGRLSGSLQRQVDLYDRELGYKRMNVERARTMEEQELISKQEAEAIEEQTIGALRQREVLVAGDVQNSLRVNQLRQQILQLELDHRERLAEFDRQWMLQRQALVATLDRFELDQFVIAREVGTIDWLPEVREGALVSSSVPLGFIIPKQGGSRKVARLQLPTDGEGRVALGDEVLLALDAYPSREFGQLTGEVLTIDPVAQLDAEQQYGRLATVLLPDSLVSSYGRPLSFQYNLTGTARIITEERTLLERLLDQFFNLSENR